MSAKVFETNHPNTFMPMKCKTDSESSINTSRKYQSMQVQYLPPNIVVISRSLNPIGLLLSYFQIHAIRIWPPTQTRT